MQFHVLFDGNCPDTWKGWLIPILYAICQIQCSINTLLSLRQLFWKGVQRTATVKLCE